MIYEVKDLEYTYPNSHTKVLDGVNLTVEEGEIITILGPNGAGKSTLLNCMARLSDADAGTINLCGKDINSLNVRDIARTVSYVQQSHTPVFPFTVQHFVLMGRCPQIGPYAKPGKEDEEAAMEALRSVGIEHLAEKPYTELSGGERQQVTIAQAIVGDPKIILFDEPTSHLDFGNQIKTLELIKSLSSRNYSIVFTTHNPDHAIIMGGRVALLTKGGKLEEGPVEEIITEEKLKEVYKTDLKLVYVEDIKRKACLSVVK